MRKTIVSHRALRKQYVETMSSEVTVADLNGAKTRCKVDAKSEWKSVLFFRGPT